MINSKYFYIPLILFGLFCYPIISADVLYRDDVARSVFSFSAWGGIGRPLSDYLMHIFSLNFNLLPNTAPLPLLSGILIVAITIWFVSIKLSKDNNPLAFCIMLTSIYVSPLFLQNIAFQFDAITMIIANSLCIISFFIYDNRISKNSLLSLIALIACLSFYQPCANIFIALTAWNILYNNAKIKSIHAIFLFVLSYAIYYFLMFYVLKISADNRSDIVAIQDLPAHLISVYSRILNYINSLGLLFKIIILVGFLSYVIIYFKGMYKERKNKIIYFLIYILSPIALLISMPGPSIILKEGITDVRVLSGASAVIAILLYSTYRLTNNKVYLLIFTLITFITISLSFQFSNAIKEQRKYEEFVLTMVSYDLTKINYNGSVYTYGAIYDSPITWKILEASPFIGHIYSPAVPWISISMMHQFSIVNVANITDVTNSNKLKDVCDNTRYSQLIHNRYYSIFKNTDSDIIISFGANPCL
ncbi:TPA: glucosyltransferase domain-containing protein [Proteus mirabilis]